jgi:methylmalonyl-CoA/ethylmalonyl-CoA epimerase
MKIHHIGILTKSLVETRKALSLQGMNFLPVIEDPLQEAILTISDGDTKIEIVEPLIKNQQLLKILDKFGTHSYHICFEVPKIEQPDVNKYFGHRLVMVSSPKPAILFSNRRVAFYISKNLGLIEVLEEFK